jgi:hypothetical protein
MRHPSATLSDMSDEEQPDTVDAGDEDARVFLERIQPYVPTTGTELNFGHLLMGVFEPIDHLREYVPVVLARLKELDSRSPVEVADKHFAGKGPSEERRAAIRAMIDDAEILLEQDLERQDFPEELATVDEATVLADLYGFLAELSARTNVSDHMLRGVMSVRNLSRLERLYFTEYSRARAALDHSYLVFRSLAVLATAQIQPYLGELLRLVISAEAHGKGRPLEREATTSQVQRLLMQGPNEWRDKVAGHFGTPELDTAIDWRALQDAWELRNLLLHRGGKVDEAYRDKLANSPLLGSLVEITEDQIEGLFDLAGTVRFAFAVATAEKLRAGRGREIAAEHYAWYWGQLERGHWRLARGIALAARAFLQDSDERFSAQCNAWIVEEREFGVDAVRDEVEAWDTTGLDPIFRLAKATLLHDDDVAMALISELLASGDLTWEDVESFPLFHRLREMGRLSGAGGAPTSVPG